MSFLNLSSDAMKKYLASASKKQKVDALISMKRKKDFLRLRREAYNPHSGQKKIHVSTALERYLFCGNGFGKTAILVNEVHWAATGFHPTKNETTKIPSKICLLLDDPYKIEDFISEYRRWNDLDPNQLHKQGKPYVSKISYKCGSTIIIYSHQVEPLKLEGSQWTHIFADEPPPRKVFNAVFRGTRIKGRPAQTLMAGTPIVGSWLRKEIYEPWVRGELSNTECFRGHSKENQENLESSWLGRFAAKLSEAEKRIRLEGQFFDLEGQALGHLFKRDTHVISQSDFNWDKNNPCVVAIDPHPEKPHVACILGADKENYLYYLKETRHKMHPREFAKHLKEFYSDYRIVDVVCDSLGAADMTGGEGFKSFIEVLKEEGIPVRSTRFEEKGDDAFITRIQDALHLPEEKNNFGQILPKLRIVDGCNGIISDIEHVQWVRDKKLDFNKPKLEISNRDFLACLKYALAANVYFKKGKTKVIRRDLPTSYGYEPKKKTNIWGEF